MTNPTPHGQVPEALIDLIDAYAETRHRCGGIYNAKTEAARKTVIEALSGVQALSAAPAIKPLVWSDESGPTDKIRYNHITAETALGQFSVEWKGWKEEDGPCVYLAGDYIGVASDLGGAKMLAEQHIRELVANLLAAPATPTAEQQARPGAVYAELPEPHYEHGDNPSMGEVNCDCYTADHLRDFADRTHALRIQAAPKAAPGEPRFNCWSTNEGDSWFDHPADAQAIYDCLGNDAKVGDEYELTAGWNSVTARYRITEVVGDGEEYEVECISHPRENTAPQQEAQEPYPIDADPQGIRAVVADAITGALAFGAQGANPPPEGHWLTPFWEMAREEAMRTKPALLSRDTLYLLRRLLSNQHTLTGSEFRAELEKIVGDAYQQEAQEPYAYAVYFPDQPKVELVHDLDELIDDLTNQTHVVTKLYTAPQPGPAPLSDDSALLDWLAIHGSFGVDSSTGEVGGNGQKRVAATRKNIRAAIAAQGGKV